ncbi:DUF262 domain-containing protein [Brachyspira aalborgi]|uniref:DUF262 domain-containing protein n=1 Tax=Brachyspira aalborgi TaxID=29522 RepID=A0A5C8E2B2_9SPIR|nr:DUF262 domain-containing protein [Brachyspira aalborgi]TXJ31438.1 DUF262 domain-containing protein [Brachyspira aalborgi]
MGIKTKDKTIEDIFQQIDYGIDFYQREYKWNDETQEHKPVKSLLEDIFYRFNLEYDDNLSPNPANLGKFEWYYLNTYMTNEINGKKFIVDGQQRLTTLTLIHIKLYHLAIKYSLPGFLIHSIKKSIYGSTAFGVFYCMGFDDRKEAIENLFNNNLNNLPANQFKSISEENIYKNYIVISDFLEKELMQNTKDIKNKVHFFILYFRLKIYLVEILIDKSKDVPMVFEVINDRGIPLEPYEVLKGKILGQIDKSEIGKYLEIWDKQVNQLYGYIDIFFSFYFRSKFADTTKQYDDLGTNKYHRTIFINEFDDKIKLKNNPKRAKEFIEYDFLYYSEIYIFLLEKYFHYDKEYEHIYFNGLNSINGQFPLILSILVYNDKEKTEKIKLVSKLFDRNFVILNLTNSYDSNRFNDSSNNLLKEIREKTVVEIKDIFDKELLNNIKRAKNRDNLQELFEYQFFKNVGYTTLSKKFLRYFFARIEHYLADNIKRATKTYHQFVSQSKGSNAHHIEHIVANNEENLKIFNDNEEEFEIQRNRLGALLIFKGKDNISSNNETFKDKLKTYDNSGILLAESLCENFYKSKLDFTNFIKSEKLNFKSYDKFGENEIEERHKLLFEISKKIWIDD